MVIGPIRDFEQLLMSNGASVAATIPGTFVLLREVPMIYDMYNVHKICIHMIPLILHQIQ